MDLETTYFLSVKDHSVSGEIFELHHDAELDMLITKPQPVALSKYYESDDYISHTDSKKSLLERVYQLVKSFATRRKVALIGNSGRGRNLLDIGAGTADFASASQKAGWNVTASEPSQKARHAAQKKGIIPVEDTSGLAESSFDVITMWHVLEHVRDPDIQVSELSRLLRADGTIIIAVPNYKSYDARYYGANWAAYDVPRHLFHYSQTSISRLFERQGMKVDKILPMPFDAFYVSLLSEKYQTGKMNIVKAIAVALKSNLQAMSTREASSHIYVVTRKSA